MSFVEIKGVKKSYGEGEAKTAVLSGIDLNIEKGEFCVLLGPSGSGKSTLLNIIGGLDKYTSGDLVINGRSTILLRPWSWNKIRRECFHKLQWDYARRRNHHHRLKYPDRP